ELARLTGMRAFFGSSMPFDGGQYGNAILTNLTVEMVQTLPLPGEPRSALCATLKKTLADSTEIGFTFMATHLDTKADPRLAAVPLIENYFSPDSAKPAIIAGDLNATPGSLTMQEFQQTWHNATSSENALNTYPVVNPEKQIDYILYRPENQWRVLETRVVEETVASDHRPILAVLEWQL
ncbi:endonuclease/exonuclease/phosphatase family protein, partial [bacterium]|nr:endonuclease/exonuclease/phosphatase family protein [bacterium]